MSLFPAHNGRFRSCDQWYPLLIRFLDSRSTVKPATKMPATPARERREPTALGKASGAKAVLSSSQSKTADVLIDQAILPAISKVCLDAPNRLSITHTQFSKQALKHTTNAADVQALQSMEQGFRILGTSNPELADQLMLDMLAGIRE